jgi:drug/metabolite transporter (DMT)-like permease
MSARNAPALVIRNSVVGLLALALLVAWYCIITPRFISPENRRPTLLVVVLAAVFLSSLWITARRFENRTWKHYLLALLVGCAVTAIVFAAFMLIMLNTVGS